MCLVKLFRRLIQGLVSPAWWCSAACVTHAGEFIVERPSLAVNAASTIAASLDVSLFLSGRTRWAHAVKGPVPVKS
jgi:hypothetical protein